MSGNADRRFSEAVAVSRCQHRSADKEMMALCAQTNITRHGPYSLLSKIIMSSKVLLIIGAGKNVGAAVASKFASEGYQVVHAARSITPGVTPEGYLGIKIDASKPSDITAVFETTKKEVGIPSVVVYNGESRCWDYFPVAFLIFTDTDNIDPDPKNSVWTCF